MRHMSSVALIAITWLLVTTVANVSQAVAAPDPTKTVFDLTDKNKDNRVDREEFHQRMIEVFYFADENKDGMLILIELEGVSAADFKAADRDGDGKLSLYEFLNARFKDFDAADTDQDGTLTVEEIFRLGPQPAAAPAR